MYSKMRKKNNQLNKDLSLINKCGQLSANDIYHELSSPTGISVFPISQLEERINASSMDVTPTIVAMSVNTGMLQTVYVKKSQYINSYYIYVKPKDTVLIVSNEYISLPNHIAGYVTSRVSNIINGFGHISTTIDPNWKGALLIGLSNPTNRSIKIEVGTSTVIDLKGNVGNVDNKKALATLTFHYLSKSTQINDHANASMRTDLLDRIQYKNRSGLKSFLRKIIYQKRKKFTDYFFEYVSVHNKDMQTLQGWNRFLDEFSVFHTSPPSKSGEKRRTKSTYDFIVKENFLTRTIHFFANRKPLCLSIFAIIVLILLKTNVISQEILDILVKIFV